LFLLWFRGKFMISKYLIDIFMKLAWEIAYDRSCKGYLTNYKTLNTVLLIRLRKLKLIMYIQPSNMERRNNITSIYSLLRTILFFLNGRIPARIAADSIVCFLSHILYSSLLPWVVSFKQLCLYICLHSEGTKVHFGLFLGTSYLHAHTNIMLYSRSEGLTYIALLTMRLQDISSLFLTLSLWHAWRVPVHITWLC
jgi:hypothetical protein